MEYIFTLRRLPKLNGSYPNDVYGTPILEWGGGRGTGKPVVGAEADVV
jgi:hypothetical protein